MVMMNRCTEVHHVGAARGPRTSLAHRTLETLPSWVAFMGVRSAAPAASVSRSRRRRSQLRARARGRARSIPTACRPRTTSAPPPLSPQGSCPVSASSSSLRGLTRRGRSQESLSVPERNAEREDGPGGVVLRRPTGRVGGDRGRRQRLGRRRVGRLRLDLRGRGLRGRCSVGRHGLDLGGGLGLRRRGLGDGRCGRRRRPGRRFGRARTRRQRHRPSAGSRCSAAEVPSRRLRNHQGGNPQPRRQRTVARGAKLGRSCATAEVVRACIVLIEVAARRAGLNTRASLELPVPRPRQSG